MKATSTVSKGLIPRDPSPVLPRELGWTTAEVDFPAPLGLAKTIVGMPADCRRPANK
jgi:hypothetical protein